MKKIVNVDKDSMTPDQAHNGFVYAVYDKDMSNDLGIIYYIDKNDYAVHNLILDVSDVNFDNLSCQPLDQLLSELCDSGYDVLQFEDLAEFGKWLTNRNWPHKNQFDVVNPGDNFSIFKFNVLVTPTRIHVIDTIVLRNNKLTVTTLCGMVETFSRSGIECNEYGEEVSKGDKWYLARFGKKTVNDYPKKCWNCRYSSRMLKVHNWTSKALDNIVRIRSITE